MTVEQLSDKITEMTKTIDDLCASRNELINQRRKMSEKTEFEKFLSWSITKGSRLIFFSKAPQDALYIIKTVYVTDIDLENHRLYVIEGAYSTKYCEPSFTCKSDCIHFGLLENIEKIFNIYSLTDVDMKDFYCHLCNLDINIENFAEFETYISKISNNTIKVDIFN